MERVVIVGAGHAGVAAAAALREEKYSGPIVLVSDETHAPYQRPPLSKAYLKGSLGRESLVLRGAAFYDQQRVDTKFGDAVVSIDRAAKQVCFGSGLRASHPGDWRAGSASALCRCRPRRCCHPAQPQRCRPAQTAA